ncbi:unnamed protein product [Sphagnum jensenii]|uniref:AP2/ERF domain-containing protein n=1 Tax=Sphagnum jensenii TaxID=128206 RepID=A0ABP1BPR5_9BRYO
MGKGCGDGNYPRFTSVRARAGSAQRYGVSSEASQSQNPAGSSVGVEELRRLSGQDTELAAKSGLPTPDEVPKTTGQATEHATSGVPNRDSEAWGCQNEGSEEALVVQLHRALHRREDPERAAGVFHRVTQDFIAVLLRWVRSLDYNLRQKLCEYILPNGEKAGKSSSKGNLAESSDAPYAKRKKPWLSTWLSTNFPGVRERNNKFGSHIRRRVPREYIWLGTYKTAEAAAQARAAAANWLATHSVSRLLNDEERVKLKECAKEAGEHLSDDRPHHNVASPDLASPDLAPTLASSEGQAVASPEHASQRASHAHENLSSPSEAHENLSSSSESWDWESVLEFIR